MCRIRFVVAVVAALAATETLRAQSESRPTTMTASLQWTRLADLPDSVGRKGMYAGASDGRIIVAGGSNFPRPRAAGGQKVLHRDIFILDEANGRSQWRLDPHELPEPMSEGGSVTTPSGIACVGGLTERGPTRRALLLRWSNERERVLVDPLPDLPVPLAHPAVAYIGNSLVVAGGDDGSGGSRACFTLALGATGRTDRATWSRLPAWAGPARFGAVMQPILFRGKPALLLAGGKEAGGDYLADAHVLRWGDKTWQPVASMPHPALQAASIALTSSEVAVLGGSDGHDLANMAALGERYRLPDRIMLYRAQTEQWAIVGAMPVGVAGAAVIPRSGGGWIVVGGEPSPSLRTAAVYHVELK